MIVLKTVVLDNSIALQVETAAVAGGVPPDEIVPNGDDGLLGADAAPRLLAARRVAEDGVVFNDAVHGAKDIDPPPVGDDLVVPNLHPPQRAVEHYAVPGVVGDDVVGDFRCIAPTHRNTVAGIVVYPVVADGGVVAGVVVDAAARAVSCGVAVNIAVQHFNADVSGVLCADSPAPIHTGDRFAGVAAGNVKPIQGDIGVEAVETLDEKDYALPLGIQHGGVGLRVGVFPIAGGVTAAQSQVYVQFVVVNESGELVLGGDTGIGPFGNADFVVILGGIYRVLDGGIAGGNATAVTAGGDIADVRSGLCCKRLSRNQDDYCRRQQQTGQ